MRYWGYQRLGLDKSIGHPHPSATQGRQPSGYLKSQLEFGRKFFYFFYVQMPSAYMYARPNEYSTKKRYQQPSSAKATCVQKQLHLLQAGMTLDSRGCNREIACTRDECTNSTTSQRDHERTRQHYPLQPHGPTHELSHDVIRRSVRPFAHRPPHRRYSQQKPLHLPAQCHIPAPRTPRYQQRRSHIQRAQ